jgi:hypothetical protein
MVISSIDSDRFVFVDECSSNTSLAPLYGWSRRGERAHQKAPRNWGKNITLLSSIGKERGMGASLVVEGSTNRTVFETYLEDVLLPTLKRGQVVVMDNLSAHKGERVRDLIEGGELRAHLPATLLARLQPHRASLLQAQELSQGGVRS